MSKSVLAQYESFLISNASTISTIESSLRSLTWFLPGRFRDAELASETLTATLNLLSLYHDTLLARRMELDPKSKPVLPPSVHSRYTRAWAKRDGGYRWAARLLEIVRFVELVIEMGMRRKLKAKTVWRGIFMLEAIKAGLKLFLLKLTRRPVLLPPIPEREMDPATLSLEPLVDPQPIVDSTSPPCTPDHIKNNRALPSPLLTPPKGGAKPMPIEDYLMGKALSTDDLRAPARLVDILASPRDWIAEVLFILRPLIYVYLLSRSPKNKSRPLAISLAIELVSRNLRRLPPPSAHLERAEYARRDRDLIWYLFRGVIWSEWTRPKLDAIAKKTQDAPLLGLLSAFIGDWVPLIDEYYYYTAT
ncbi:peroxisomal membrane protein PEX16 [Ceratobasidium sp. AG-Ba]|nr:peroxisomal membrane protein PEX16 [Ceratobasidium sp. AG-Ba]